MRLHFLNPPIPQELPEDLELKINALKQYKTKSEALLKAYTLLTVRYRGYRLKTVTHLPDLVNVDIAKMWERSGFLHCTKLNYLLRILLINSGQFTEDEINLKWTTINFLSPHQYARVRIDGERWINIDLWGKAYGIKFGDYGHGFHSGSLKSPTKKTIA